MHEDVGTAPTFRSVHLKFRKAAQPRRSLAKAGRKSTRNSFQRGGEGTSASMLEIWEKQRREDQLGLQKAITLIFLLSQEL
jgi:hypothetical protein